MKPKIGIIGAGVMGKGVAERLLAMVIKSLSLIMT